MAKFRKKLISATEPLATAAGIRSPVEQLQDLNALSISVVTVCADTSGTDGGLADDTAINTAGGFVKITGTGFRNTAPTTIVYINGVTATYNYLSSTSIVVTVPAATAGTTASLIVFNGSTVGSIWAAGISYSGFPSWTTTAASNNGLVVSTQLVAAGDAPLVYTFVSGTLPPNCTISSSGLLSGTVTGVSTNVIYTFTVAVTDAQNQNVSQSIVYTLVVSDFYYRYTSLHISGDSNPTWITDASTNALAVTTTGSPQATIFSPLKAGYYGNSFNGSSDYLSVPFTAGGPLDFGAGNFTIEYWINTTVNGNTTGIGYFNSGGDYGYAWILTVDTSNIRMQISSAAVTTSLDYSTSGVTITDGTWHHIALVRSSNTFTTYVDGIARGTGTSSITLYAPSQPLRIGMSNTYPGYFTGYISNYRIVKGTAVYTANFTPSATPLTAITNTSLLTCQSARFIDNSAAAATITANSTPKVVSSNPFNLPSGLAAYGSGYFNGSSYLNIPSNATLAMGSGSFTWECWIYPTSLSATYSGVLDTRPAGGASANAGMIYFGTNTLYYFSNSINVVSYASFPLNTWTHVAVVRNGASAITLYVNGISVSTGTSATSLTSSSVIIGSTYDNYYFSGYISNARIINGTAVYTAAFTPPTAPLTAITNTSLLTLQTNVPHNNSQFRDISSNNFLVTRVGNPTQGSFSPFTKQYPYSTTTVGGSVYFDSTAGDYLNIADPTSTFNFGSGNFTVEAWVYAKSGQSVMIWGNGSSGSNWVAFYTSTSAEFAIAINGAVPLDVLTGTNSIIPDQWSHVALVRNSDVFTIYINGIKGNSGTRAGVVPYYDATNTYFGGPRWPGDTASSNGYMSNLRIIKGTAVYTSNFTPSTTPLTAIPGTVLLMPFTNAAVYDNTMLNNFETVGNVQVNTSTLKYGTGALKFNGTTDYLTIPASANTSFGTGNFTVEFWINTAGANSQILSLASGTAAGNWQVTLYNGNFYWQSARNTTDALYVASASITNSQWHHVAITRTSNTLRIFFDGAQQGSVTDSTNYNVTSVLNIGYSTTYFNGYIDELRITKGFARYTATFTPATGAYSVSAPFGASILPSKSLRFRASASAYLNRTPAIVGNQKTWTWSGWVKRGTLGVYAALFAQGTGSVGNGYGFLRFDSNDTLSFTASADGNTASAAWASTPVYRDPAAWYHVVAVLDTTQAYYGNRFKLYVNGVLQSGTFSASPGQNVDIQVNRAALHQIGVTYANGFGNYFDGEMAEVNFVDGLALEPTMFGAYSTYGQWLPVSYAGYQGANGFYLPFNVDTLSVNYLVVAGGGSGGGAYGGGGGAGGLLSGSSLAIAPGSAITVTVGAGGAATGTGVNQGNNGSNSVLGSLTAIAGGGGGSNGVAGKTGGSAGGSSYNTYSATAGTAGQGNAGGYAPFTDTATNGNASAGGGGAGAVGSNALGSSNVDNGGNGGIGLQSSISGTSAYYAGGGGGGSGGYNVAHTATSGGLGGGAGGGVWNNGSGTSATANTGGGGGGGSGGAPGGAGGAGGSGIVIVSYTGAQKLIGGTVTSVGGNTIHTFTASGTLINAIADSSGNANNWTPNNINVSTVGPTYDLLTDVPTLTSATAANYCVLLQTASYMGGQSTITDGNLNYQSPNPSSNYASSGVRASIPFASGKFYWEALINLAPGANGGYFIGVTDSAANLNSGGGFYSGYFWGYNVLTGAVQVNGSTVVTVATSTLNDIIGLAYDRTAGTMSIYKNNTLLSTQTATPSGAGGMWVPSMIIDQGYNDGRQIGFNYTFGQRPFTYTPPANFLALNTYNI